MDGGRAAARGFQYQYARTLECLVRLVDDAEAACVRVEGPPPGSTTVADAVDFDVLGRDGAVLYAAQVKSKSPGLTFGAAQAVDVLIALVCHQDARRYALLTNADPSAGLQRLSDVLASARGIADLRDALVELVARSNERATRVRTLEDEAIERLRRCHIEIDPRTDEQIRSELRERLRAYRNRSHTGLGERSAGLLSGYLRDEVFRRAADVEGRTACFEIDELRGLLLVPGEELARALGRRDWGVVVGAMPPAPDIPRPEITRQLTDALALPTLAGVRRAALVGPSGIGKSNLAVLYLAETADAYDITGWIECETPEATAASFHRLLRALDPAAAEKTAGAADSAAQQAVHLALAQLVGRWLLIFDNAASPRQLEPWIPTSGHGDVLINTLNAAENLGATTTVTVPVMRREQSVELLRRRLHLGPALAAVHQAALDTLAAGLEDWPLALELGAGYMRSCGIPPEQAAPFLQQLTLRSLSDTDAVPPGYPRTLAAALGLCLDRLEERAQAASGVSAPAAAVGALYAAAFLASRQIPGHLLLAALFADTEENDPTDRSPILVPPSVVSLGETIRELHRFSIVRDDLPLPETGDMLLPDAGRTIAANTIVQTFVRTRIANASPDLAEALAALLWHVEQWLSAATMLGETERAYVMRAHAETLLAHCEELGVTGNRVNLLYGNLAGCHYATGDIPRAEALLQRELHQLRDDETGETLRVQTRLTLAQMALHNQFIDGAHHPARTTVQDAIHHLEYVLAVSRGWADPHPDSALRLATDAAITLRNPGIANAPVPALTMLRAAFEDLASRLPDTQHARNATDVEHAEHHLRTGDYAAAERLCRDVLNRELAGPLGPEARRCLIEALALQRQWPQAIHEVRFWQSSPTAPSLYWGSILHCIRNTGVAIANAIHAGDLGAIALINTLSQWPELNTMKTSASPEDRKAIDLITGLAEHLSSRG